MKSMPHLQLSPSQLLFGLVTQCPLFLIWERAFHVTRPNNGCKRDYTYCCSSNREKIKIICQQLVMSKIWFHVILLWNILINLDLNWQGFCKGHKPSHLPNKPSISSLMLFFVHSPVIHDIIYMKTTLKHCDWCKIFKCNDVIGARYIPKCNNLIGAIHILMPQSD